MSHELRTPLIAIIGFSEMIRDQSFGPIGAPIYAEYAEDILAGGHHLLGLVNDLLDLAKIEAGKMEIAPEAIDLKQRLPAYLRLVQGRAQRKGQTFQLLVQEGLSPLWADERAAKQIIFNLLSNSIKFTPPGGLIGVRAEATPEGGVAITVTDSGVGIPAGQVGRVLCPFEQIDNQYSRTTDGTGLGLPLVKSLVELHGGSLTIESQEGIGTTVSVRFPRRRVRAGADDKADTAPLP
jgi:two-component system, cell cycle sensor histidine kinase PleC